MNMINTFDSIAKAAERANPPAPGDYIQDGLLYCGKCHTPKQAIIPFPVQRTVSCICACVAEKIATEQREYEAKLQREEIARNRTEAFHDRAMFECTFERDDMKNPKLHTAARNYVANFDKLRKDGKGLLLYGNCGTGKSFIAACIANALTDTGYKVLMTSTGRLINHISTLNEGKQKYINSLSANKLVILDDLGAERDTEFAQAIVFDVVESLTRSGTPMIITTNLTSEELKNPGNIIHQRIYSRLLGNCHPIEVKGAERRKIKLTDSYAEMQELLGL